ncbi:hypothetical protein B4923_16145 [Brenneria roseae subsp. americana]|uniref:HEPN domain-containing protein n=1 Tax=Brenneria roseae subsp. americana TaxID=1508507 RepID=A0A2U1TMM4_9GAMM|nr:hypothetical protein [Brenneria roseae]PWC10651.1 hypothetical protein B4923_16145 [Brenneria roseae subsp. americana]
MVNHNDFIKIAESLLLSEDEISIRTATSRAYYGMYHFAMNLVNNKVPKYDHKTVRGGVHERLTHYLMHDAAEVEGLDPVRLQKLAIKLKAAKRNRVVADYYISVNVPLSTAQETVLEVRSVSEIFNNE